MKLNSEDLSELAAFAIIIQFGGCNIFSDTAQTQKYTSSITSTSAQQMHFKSILSSCTKLESKLKFPYC